MTAALHLGILPIIQWLSSIERKAPTTRNLLTIERVQAWSMLLFYPLDHTRYLLSNSVLSDKTPSLLARISGVTKKSSDGTTSLDAGKISRLSCKMWLLYTIMQLGHLREDRKILVAEARSLSKTKVLVQRDSLSRHNLTFRTRSILPLHRPFQHKLQEQRFRSV